MDNPWEFWGWVFLQRIFPRWYIHENIPLGNYPENTSFLGKIFPRETGFGNFQKF